MGARIKAGNSLSGETKTLEFPSDWTLSEDSDGHVRVTAGGVSSAGDVTISSDTDASGAGDILLKTAGVLRGAWRSSSDGRLDIGAGTAYGAPASAPTLATGGAGALTGVYKYAYTEVDFYGETTASPLGTYTASAEKIQVTVPKPRRGVSSRKLYRTAAGGSQLKLIGVLPGAAGDGYYMTVFLDNVADGSLGANVPTTDTTAYYHAHWRDGVKYLRSSPTLGANVAADLTVLNSDPGGTAYAIDAYGPILARSGAQNASLIAQQTGSGNNLFAGYHVADTGLDVTGTPTSTLVANIGPNGYMALTPDSDSGNPILNIVPPSGATSLSLRLRNIGNTVTVFSVDATGQTTVKTSSNSSTAFVVRNSGDTVIFQVDTNQPKLVIGNAAQVNFGDGCHIQTGTSTGTKIGLGTTQKIGFFNATPIVQPATTGTAVGFTAGAGTTVTHLSTFTGNTGSAAYTIGDIVLALKNLGLLAA